MRTIEDKMFKLTNIACSMQRTGVPFEEIKRVVLAEARKLNILPVVK